MFQLDSVLRIASTYHGNILRSSNDECSSDNASQETLEAAGGSGTNIFVHQAGILHVRVSERCVTRKALSRGSAHLPVSEAKSVALGISSQHLRVLKHQLLVFDDCRVPRPLQPFTYTDNGVEQKREDETDFAESEPELGLSEKANVRSNVRFAS